MPLGCDGTDCTRTPETSGAKRSQGMPWAETGPHTMQRARSRFDSGQWLPLAPPQANP